MGIDLVIAVAAFTLGGVFTLTVWPGRKTRPPKVIVAAKTVHNRTMPNYSRAQRRAHKRRRREPTG